MAKPVVALVGRPNVGKSTLFNRLAEERLAVVDEVPGTTRDRLLAEADWAGFTFTIVDTGGIDPTLTARGHGKEPLSVGSAQFIDQIRIQAEVAIREADAVLFMVDAESGVTPADEEVAQILRRNQRLRDGEPFPPVFLVVNKADSQGKRNLAYQFYELGMGEPFPISAIHGTGTGDLLDALVATFEEEAEQEDDESVKIAIAGKPNVGKSTLLNRLAERDVAIVSAIAGTTRDAIEVALDLKGVPVVLVDTAGVRRSKDPIELEGVKRALARAATADLVLWLTEARGRSPAPPKGARTIMVRTKADLLDSEVQRRLQDKESISISAKTGAGMARLLDFLAHEAEALSGEPALVTRERQRMALAEALKRLEAAVDIAAKGKEELVAEELRMAANALGRITGRIGVEEVLGEIFRSFCIGK